MLSQAEIQEHITKIRSSIDGLEQDQTDLAPCVDTQGRLDALRAQYKESPVPLTAYLEELAELRLRFNRVLAARLPQVVDRFHVVTQEVHRAEEEKAVWRDILIEQASESRNDSLRGMTSMVQIRTRQSRKLPPTTSDDRKELEHLVRQAGLWDELSQLSRPKLEKSLGSGQFPPQTASAIEQLCPAMPSHQVTVRSLTQ